MKKRKLTQNRKGFSFVFMLAAVLIAALLIFFLLRNMNSSGLSPTRDKEDILDQAQEAVDLMNRRNESAVQEQ